MKRSSGDKTKKQNKSKLRKGPSWADLCILETADFL